MSEQIARSEEMSMRRKINGMQFACWELHLFLDTHPNNCEAARRLEEYRQRLARAVKEFEDRFGPLGETSRDTSRWAWINGPWPWEREANE